MIRKPDFTVSFFCMGTNQQKIIKIGIRTSNRLDGIKTRCQELIHHKPAFAINGRRRRNYRHGISLIEQHDISPLCFIDKRCCHICRMQQECQVVVFEHLGNSTHIVVLGKAHMAVDRGRLIDVQVHTVLNEIDALGAMAAVEILLIPAEARFGHPLACFRVFDVHGARIVAIALANIVKKSNQIQHLFGVFVRAVDVLKLDDPIGHVQAVLAKTTTYLISKLIKERLLFYFKIAALTK